MITNLDIRIPSFIQLQAHFLKAESNYQLGNFEQGLLHFHKASALRPAASEYKQGVKKCQNAIENVIGGLTSAS